MTGASTQVCKTSRSAWWASGQGRSPPNRAKAACLLLDSIDTSTPIGLRDHALIRLMVYTFARVGAAIKAGQLAWQAASPSRISVRVMSRSA
jgi:hypothetical protein